MESEVFNVIFSEQRNKEQEIVFYMARDEKILFNVFPAVGPQFLCEFRLVYQLLHPMGCALDGMRKNA